MIDRQKRHKGRRNYKHYRQIEKTQGQMCQQTLQTERQDTETDWITNIYRQIEKTQGRCDNKHYRQRQDIETDVITNIYRQIDKTQRQM